MTDKIYISRIFNNLKKDDYKKIKIDKESLMYVTNYKDSDNILNIIETHIKKIKTIEESIIVDATGGIGGDTITFAKKFLRVFSIELNLERFQFLKNNVEDVYELKNVVVVNGDSLIIIPKLHNIDVIYIDPPWGGKTYKDQQLLKLNFGDKTIENAIVDFFDETKMVCVPKLLILKLPKNYDIKYMHDTIKQLNKDDKIKLHLYELKKIEIIVIENF
jgi:16S rRNA G966 N2-methylase RsmD